MNRPRTKRYLGMTIPQLGVLAGLGLCICCTLVGGYSWLNSMVAAAYEVPVINLTLPPPPTPLPTETPPPTPSPTPITYESLIPAGWELFLSESAPGMEVWLPSSYEAYTENPNMQTVTVYEGEGFEKLVSVLRLTDMTQSPYLLYTTFQISTQPLPASNIDKTIELVFADMKQAARLVESDVFEIGDYPARKLVFDITGNGVNAGLVAYVIQDNVTVWYLGFTTPYNELYTRMPDFDRTAQTFRIVKP